MSVQQYEEPPSPVDLSQNPSNLKNPSVTAPHSTVMADGTPHSMSYYGLCFLGGALASSIRWIKTPLDNVKCNMQVGRFPTFSKGITQIYQAEGLTGLYRGLVPTMLAYGTQTGFKYGLYEVFKDQILRHIEEDDNTSQTHRGLVYLVAAAGAESIADVFMCPWEMLKVRVQTDPKFPKGFVSGLWRINSEPTFPFGSLGPLLARQVPTTVANFCTFEFSVNAIYQHVLAKPKDSCDTGTQLGVTLAAGYVAGLVSTVLSHPADTILSLKARPEFSQVRWFRIVQSVGLWKLCTMGIGPRVAMTGSIIAFQWFFYDSFKTALGHGTTGGSIMNSK